MSTQRSSLLPTATREYFTHPSLAPLWVALRKRLEGNGLQATGVLTLNLDEAGADRLGGLLGRRVTNPTRVRLADLDAALRRSAAAAGLVAVTQDLTGPLEDRKAVKAARDEARASTAGLLDAALATAGVADQAWVAEFVEGVRLGGVLTKAGAAAPTAISHAGRALAELAASGVLTATDPEWGLPEVPEWRGLAELATRCTGDAHGLDSGRLAAALVLRAAAAALGVRSPESASAARELWGQLGVTSDEVSGTVMVWGLRPPGRDAWSAMMRARADLGLVTHLTLHELDAAADVQFSALGALVSVCENPQVLQAAARARSAGVLVCTSGNPASAGWRLMRGMLSQGVRLRYHGDFDWPGIAIAGRVVAAGAEPWRLGAVDYAAAVAASAASDKLALTGRSVATPWDPRLAAEMSHTGAAVHEEALLPVLLRDLAAVRHER